MLYPYRANDPKNRVRWQFGVLAPPSYVEADSSERSFLQTDCLLEGDDVQLSVQVRFLQVQRRTVEQATADGFTPVDSLDVGDATYLPWDEAVLHESEATFTLPGSAACADSTELHVDGGRASRGAAHRRRSSRRPSRARSVSRLTPTCSSTPNRCPARTVCGDCGCAWRTARRGHRPTPARRIGRTHCAARSSRRTCWWPSPAARSCPSSTHPSGPRVTPQSCEQVGAFPVLAGPRRGPPPRAGLADHLVRPPAPRARERVAVLRRHRDGRDADPAHADADRRREAAGEGQRSARRRRSSTRSTTCPVELMDRLHGAIRSMTQRRPPRRAERRTSRRGGTRADASRPETPTSWSSTA